MLVLSRKKNEKVVIQLEDGREVKVTVVKIDNMNRVRIGIEADSSINIYRPDNAVVAK